MEELADYNSLSLFMLKSEGSGTILLLFDDPVISLLFLSNSSAPISPNPSSFLTYS